MDGTAYVADVIKRFRELKQQCDRAMAQVPYEQWSHRIDPESNSIVTLMLHLSGNMLSRWSDFLTSDGEKASRNRDAEFEDPASLTQEALVARWERGWSCLFGALTPLTDGDLARVVTIRSQPHTVVEAIHRQLTHYGVHTGQIVFLAKHLAGPKWQTLSVPRGGSSAFNEKLTKKT